MFYLSIYLKYIFYIYVLEAVFLASAAFEYVLKGKNGKGGKQNPKHNH